MRRGASCDQCGERERSRQAASSRSDAWLTGQKDSSTRSGSARHAQTHNTPLARARASGPWAVTFLFARQFGPGGDCALAIERERERHKEPCRKRAHGTMPHRARWGAQSSGSIGEPTPDPSYHAGVPPPHPDHGPLLSHGLSAVALKGEVSATTTRRRGRGFVPAPETRRALCSPRAHSMGRSRPARSLSASRGPPLGRRARASESVDAPAGRARRRRRRRRPSARACVVAAPPSLSLSLSLSPQTRPP